MKKFFFVVALLVVVASCTKNEVIPQNDGNNEITYLTAPLTKASPFVTSNRFYSYAYLLTSGNWATNSSSSSLYINEAEIYHQTSVWKAAQSYYWPKNDGSSLTFFAWSNGTGTLVDAIGECSNTKGVQFPNYNVSEAGNKNKDMMVAEIAADKTANTNSGVVPTLFYHVLSSLEIKAKVAASYDGVTFKVKNITLKDNSVQGTYTQGVDATKLPTAAGTWAQASPVVTADLQVYDNAGLTLTTSEQALAATDADYRILLPHEFADSELMQITYDIVTTVTPGTPPVTVTETVTVSKKLSEIFTENTPDESWEAGKKYTLTITLSMNEILWDPAVEAWEPGTGSWGI